MDLEVHIKDGRCRVVEGPAKRVFHTTEEALGLALLKLNPASVPTGVRWMDFLASKGVAFAASGTKTFTLLALPAQERVIDFRRGTNPGRKLAFNFPPLLLAVGMDGVVLKRTSLWVIKAGEEGKLSIASDARVLAAFPYGNVYPHGGVCWGSTVVRDIQGPQDVEHAFFGSGFNGDLFYPPSFTTASFPTLVELHQSVKKELPPPFPASFTKSVATVAQDITREGR